MGFHQGLGLGRIASFQGLEDVDVFVIQFNFGFYNHADLANFIRQAKVLFVNQAERSTLLPDVPTAAEVGLPDYKAYSWYGIFGPANLPEPVVTRMAAAIEQALADPTTSARFNDMGTPPMRGWTPQRFATYVADEVVAWAPLVRASGARVE